MKKNEMDIRMVSLSSSMTDGYILYRKQNRILILPSTRIFFLIQKKSIDNDFNVIWNN